MKTKLTLHNETTYSARELRSITIWCLKHMGVEAKKNWRVYIRHSRGPWVSGKAYLGGNTSIMYLPRKGTTYASYAKVMIHEFQHNLGFVHRDMTNCRNFALNTFPWDKAKPLTPREPKAKPKPTAQEKHAKKLAAAKRNLENWERKLKRAQNAIKKWKRKIKYYEGYTPKERVAAAPREPEGPQQHH